MKNLTDLRKAVAGLLENEAKIFKKVRGVCVTDQGPSGFIDEYFNKVKALGVSISFHNPSADVYIHPIWDNQDQVQFIATFQTPEIASKCGEIMNALGSDNWSPAANF